MAAVLETTERVADLAGEKYKYGFVNRYRDGACRKRSKRRHRPLHLGQEARPEWMLEWRLEAFRRWKEMTEPNWARVHYPPIDYQNAYYYAAAEVTGRASQEP